MNLMQYLIPRGFMVDITTPLEGDGVTSTHTTRVHHLVMMLGMLRYINKQAYGYRQQHGFTVFFPVPI